MAPHNCYRTKGDDKWVSIAVATDEEWKALCNVMGNPHWAMDAKYGDAYSRWQNRKELDARMSEWTKDYTHYEVMKMLQEAGVAAMPSFSAEEILTDCPHEGQGAVCDGQLPGPRRPDGHEAGVEIF